MYHKGISNKIKLIKNNKNPIEFFIGFIKNGDILFVMGLIVTTVILHKIHADNAKTIPI